MIKLDTCKIEHQYLKKHLFEIFMTLYKVEKFKTMNSISQPI